MLSVKANKLMIQQEDCKLKGLHNIGSDKNANNDDLGKLVEEMQKIHVMVS